MEWTLGIDTASSELGLGLSADGRGAAGLSRYMANSHAEQITDAVKYLMSSSGISAGSIARAGVTVGPGSFTGLRIGIGFIKGLLFGREARVLPISSLESIVCAWQGRAAAVTVILDARRGEVFWARFCCSGAVPKRMTTDALSTLTQVQATLGENEVVLFDALGYGRSTVPQELAGYDLRPVESLSLQRGLACARLAAAEAPDSLRWLAPVDLMPEYMRASAPEELAARKP